MFEGIDGFRSEQPSCHAPALIGATSAPGNTPEKGRLDWQTARERRVDLRTRSSMVEHRSGLMPTPPELEARSSPATLSEKDGGRARGCPCEIHTFERGKQRDGGPAPSYRGDVRRDHRRTPTILEEHRLRTKRLEPLRNLRPQLPGDQGKPSPQRSISQDVQRVGGERAETALFVVSVRSTAGVGQLSGVV